MDLTLSIVVAHRGYRRRHRRPPGDRSRPDVASEVRRARSVSSVPATPGVPADPRLAPAVPIARPDRRGPARPAATAGRDAFDRRPVDRDRISFGACSAARRRGPRGRPRPRLHRSPPRRSPTASGSRVRSPRSGGRTRFPSPSAAFLRAEARAPPRPARVGRSHGIVVVRDAGIALAGLLAVGVVRVPRLAHRERAFLGSQPAGTGLRRRRRRAHRPSRAPRPRPSRRPSSAPRRARGDRSPRTTFATERGARRRAPTSVAGATPRPTARPTARPTPRRTSKPTPTPPVTAAPIARRRPPSPEPTPLPTPNPPRRRDRPTPERHARAHRRSPSGVGLTSGTEASGCRERLRGARSCYTAAALTGRP